MEERSLGQTLWLQVKIQYLHLLLDTGESARAKAAGYPASFPVPGTRICVRLCFHVAIWAGYFWSRELLDTFLCFSAPHLFLEPPPALAASGEAVLQGKIAVNAGIAGVFSAGCSSEPSAVISVLLVVANAVVQWQVTVPCFLSCCSTGNRNMDIFAHRFSLLVWSGP